MTRRFFRRGSARGLRRPRRERAWINKHFDVAVHNNSEVAYFELLADEDYLEGDNPQKTDSCTLLRSIGRFELDVGFNPEEFSTVTWLGAAALVVVSSTALANAFAATTEQFYSPFEPSLHVRVRVVQHFGVLNFVHTEFGPRPGGPFGAVYTAMGSDPSISWDVTQKVKMQTDEALYLAISGLGQTVDPEDSNWFTTGFTRTLFAD